MEDFVQRQQKSDGSTFSQMIFPRKISWITYIHKLEPYRTKC